WLDPVHVAPQRPDGPEGEPPHGARPTPHHPCRFLCGEPRHETKHDRFLLVGGEVGDRAAQLADLLAAQADGLHLVTVRLIMDRVELFHRSVATNVVDDRIPRDAEDPGREWAASGSVAWQSGHN